MSIEDIQPENGWMPIANDLAEAFATRNIPPTTMRVFWVILREIYGWEEKRIIRQAAITTKRFRDITGLNRQRISEAIHWLNNQKMIKVFADYSENPDKEETILVTKKRTRCYGNPVYFVRKSGITCPEIRNKFPSNGHSDKALRVSKERFKEILNKYKERNGDIFKRKGKKLGRALPSTFEGESRIVE